MDQRPGIPAAPDLGPDLGDQFVSGGFEDLDWQPLRLVPDPGAALPPVETRFAFAHPRHGVALVDIAPAAAPEPAARLRRRLEADGEPGALPPILHLVLSGEDVWRLSMVLDSALLALPPGPPPEAGWIDRVQRALLPATEAAPAAAASVAPVIAVPAAAPAPAPVAPAPARPVRPSPAMRPAGGKAPASAVAASSRPGLGRWRWPVLATLGLLAGGAAALQLLGPLPTEPPAAPVLAEAAPPPAPPAAPPGQPAAAAPVPEAPPAQVATLPIPPPPPPARAPAPASAPPPPPPPLPDARRVVAEAAQPPAESEAAPALPRPGRLRIVAHYRLGGRSAAAALTGRAVPNSDVELRQVGATPDVAVVRYFAPTDHAAAMQLASRLGGGWAVQDFTHFAPRPSAGTLEVWLPRSLAGG